MNIIVAYDGSDSSQYALNTAIQLTQKTQGALLVATSVEPIYSVSDYQVPGAKEPWIRWQNSDEKEWKEALENIVQQQDQKLRQLGETLLAPAKQQCGESNISFDTTVLLGYPQYELANLVEEKQPDLLIVGSRGRGAFKRMFLGSVSDYLIHHATCSVLVTRGTHSD